MIVFRFFAQFPIQYSIPYGKFLALWLVEPIIITISYFHNGTLIPNSKNIEQQTINAHAKNTCDNLIYDHHRVYLLVIKILSNSSMSNSLCFIIPEKKSKFYGENINFSLSSSNNEKDTPRWEVSLHIGIFSFISSSATDPGIRKH